MFEQSILLPQPTGKRWTFAASVVAEVTAVSVLLLIPLIYTEQLGQGWIRSSVIGAPTPPTAPSIQLSAATVHPSARRFRSTDLRPPSQIVPLVQVMQSDFSDPPPPCLTCVVGALTSTGSGPIRGIGDGVIVPPPPPRAKPAEVQKPAEVKPSGPVRVSLGTQEAKIIRRVIPTYPALARTARVQGTVRLLGVINKEGRIEQLQVLSGHPLLIQAAVDAVKQWIYRPTLLSGQPVDVMAPIDVNFILN